MNLLIRIIRCIYLKKKMFTENILITLFTKVYEDKEILSAMASKKEKQNERKCRAQHGYNPLFYFFINILKNLA